MTTVEIAPPLPLVNIWKHSNNKKKQLSGSFCRLGFPSFGDPQIKCIRSLLLLLLLFLLLLLLLFLLLCILRVLSHFSFGFSNAFNLAVQASSEHFPSMEMSKTVAPSIFFFFLNWRQIQFLCFFFIEYFLVSNFDGGDSEGSSFGTKRSSFISNWNYQLLGSISFVWNSFLTYAEFDSVHSSVVLIRSKLAPNWTVAPASQLAPTSHSNCPEHYSNLVNSKLSLA